MPSKQTEQELKLADTINDLVEKYGYSLNPLDVIKAFKEAGWVSPEYLKEFGRTVHYAAKVGWVKLADLAVCPECKSIWVCWNWIHPFGGDRKRYEEANPHIPPEKLLDWGHECWDCENCFETNDRITNGIPYEFLKSYYRKGQAGGK